MQKIGQHQPIELKRSVIQGWGVFAVEDIQTGVSIECQPGIIVPMEILRMSYFIMMSDGVSPDSFKLDQYGIDWPNDKVFIPLGWVGLYNHSDDPSAEFYKDEQNELVGIRSVRDIVKGEEITISYGPTWWERKDYLQKA